MKLAVHSLLCFGIAASLAACGKKKDTPAAATDTPTATTITSGLSKASSTFSSAGNLAHASSLWGGQALTADAWTHYAECNAGSGWPVSDPDYPNASAGSSGGSQKYNEMFVGCALKEPDDGGEGIVGAIASVSGVACAAGENIVFDGQEHAVKVPLTTACFPAGLVTTFTDDLKVTSMDTLITASTTEFYGNTTGKWKGSVRIKTSFSPAGGSKALIDRIILFKEGTGSFAFVVVNGPATDAPGLQKAWQNAYAATINTTDGSAQFEYRRPNAANDSGQQASRHIRTYLKGTFADTGAITNLTDVELAIANYYVSSGPIGSLKTVKGNPTDGFKMFTYESSQGNVLADAWTAAKNPKVLDFCFPTGTSCTSNNGIAVATDADMQFLLQPGTATENEIWFKALEPLSFTTAALTEKP